MLGYIYTTEQEAIDSRELVDTYYGIPVSPDDVTQNWVDYQIANLDNPIYWYIIFDESLEVVLGTPIEIILTQPQIPLF